MDFLSKKYNNNFNGSLVFTNFWEQKIVIDQGYSFSLDINTVLANFFSPSTEEFYDTNNKRKYRVKSKSKHMRKSRRKMRIKSKKL